MRALRFVRCRELRLRELPDVGRDVTDDVIADRRRRRSSAAAAGEVTVG